MSLAVAPRLTRRQGDVLRLLAAGLPSQEIAQQLRLRPMTVRHHLSALYRKLGCRTGTQAVLYALQHQLIALPEPEEGQRKRARDLHELRNLTADSR